MTLLRSHLKDRILLLLRLGGSLALPGLRPFADEPSGQLGCRRPLFAERDVAVVAMAGGAVQCDLLE